MTRRAAEALWYITYGSTAFSSSFRFDSWSALQQSNISALTVDEDPQNEAKMQLGGCKSTILRKLEVSYLRRRR